MRNSRVKHLTGAMWGALALTVPLVAVSTPASAAGADLSYTRTGKFVEVAAGATATDSVSCPSGYTAVDGGFQVDADSVGESTDVVVTSSNRGNAAGKWTTSVSNGSGDRITGRVRVTCLGNKTVGGQSLTFGTGQATVPFGTTATDWFATAAAACPGSATIPVGSGWTLDGDAYLLSSTVSGSTWTHYFEGAGAGSVTSTVYCVATSATSSAGEVTLSTVPSTTAGAETTVRDGSAADATASCPEGSLAVTGTFAELTSGVYYLGSESAYKDVRQRFYNDSGASAKVSTDAVCLASSAEAAPEPSISLDGGLTMRTAGSKTYLVGDVTCANVSPQCRTVTGKVFEQKNNGSRGARVATGKTKYAGAGTDLRMRVLDGPGVSSPSGMFIVVLKANGITVVTKDVTVAAAP